MDVASLAGLATGGFVGMSDVLVGVGKIQGNTTRDPTKALLEAGICFEKFNLPESMNPSLPILLIRITPRVS